MASTNLSRTLSSGAAINKFTLSMWVKRSVDTAGRLFTATGSSGDTYFRFNGDATMEWSGDASNASSAGYFITNRKFDDYSGWYHLVIRFDSTQGSASDRVRFYVNGVQEESFSSYTDVNQNAVDKINLSGNTHYIGGTVSSQYFHGLMSHVNYSDGYSYAPTEFGETDSTTGEWKIQASPSISYGTNGFFILKDGATLTDSSPNSNNFAVANGTLTNTEDNPSNVFATINGLFQPDPSNGTFSTTNGGLSFTTNITSQSMMGVSTIGATSGKYYAEFKLTGESGAARSFAGIGYNIYDQATTSLNADNNFMWNVCSNGVSNQGGSAQPSGNWSNLYTTNDIISVAMDLDNNKVYFAKNGQYADGSGNWDEAFTGSPAYATITADKTYFFCAGDIASSTNSSWTCNFGNGYFATTAISSEGTNASGIGKFEYDVPAGYTALSTKGLNL
ncbi:lectin domain containing protein [uncultured Mediterranean phage uvMED]|uniref:B30.2/SPRY domain-containing protein n=1 Tax=uncultured organism MedDCM-OCT-S11-C359 TaxID=743661 RepID=D6PLH3_9ZZZZ|nr:hypothetical protein [uncultured organism MedDCM-OCT-S11-C359]BAQ88752.1 lectin domain containing protein [uncultured Mediterranean phage uvMED]BAR18596.1 lectin domain containing protein [uncultured Mediterranean phage uvMED]BAR18711.1 lectin domain containing protein [uncultured Mediterranean phage uvMED]BAR18776.1 lectin domain containing protein [uncultured Mediterranean phage uvMED]